MTRATLGAAAICAAALVLSGCSKGGAPPIVPAEGVVLLNGQPLANALVSFVPNVPDLGYEYVAVGTTDENGRFQLTCKGQPGACASENRVTVVDAPIPEGTRGNQTAEARYYAGLKNRPIPDLYANVAKTPLSVTVTAGQTDYKVELKR
jgi:hypothetical protein